MIELICADIMSPAYSDPWAYTARSFDVRPAQMRISGRSSSELPLVAVQAQDGHLFQGTIALPDFEHPEECAYWFGATDGINTDPAADFYVYIPAAPTWEMYSHQAAAIVLYDRYVKRGARG